MITGYDLIEKMYSENYDEYEDTRLYSTGNNELDDLLERAFCEGYEYAQREFNSKAQKEMRRGLDLKLGAKGMVELENQLTNKNEVKRLVRKKKGDRGLSGVDSLIKMGRLKRHRDDDKLAHIGSTIDSSINSKAVNRGGLFIDADLPTASGLRLLPGSDRQHFSKKRLKKEDIHTYDHGKSSPSWNKEVMELVRDNINRKK